MKRRSKISDETASMIECYEMASELWSGLYRSFSDMYGDDEAAKIMNDEDIGKNIESLQKSIGCYIIKSIDANIGDLSKKDTI